MKGKRVKFRQPYKGYTAGESTGVMKENRHSVLLTSGKVIWLYSDEFEELN
jgi:hypothetical protein